MTGAPDLARVEDALRGATRSGQPILAILDVWTALEAFALQHEDALLEMLEGAANVEPSVGGAAGLSPEQAGVALVSPGSRSVWSDERFRRWIGDPRKDQALARLVREAQVGRPAMALVSTETRAVFPVLAARMSPGSKWRDVVAALGGEARAGDVLLIAFAPSRSRGLVIRAARSIGLSAVEAELTATLIEEPSVEAAAYRLGLNVETARDAMRRAVRRTGARNTAQLIGKVLDLSSGQADRPFPEPQGADRLLGLTPAELRLARVIADGDSSEAAAKALGLTTETVKSYRRTIFAKLGVNRARDLRRLITETRALQALDDAVEVPWDRPTGGNLRILVDGEGRSVAFTDYGPASGRPLALFHGSTTGRLAAPPLLAALQARGYRVMVPQRPGFGLTSPAARGGFAETAAADLALILERARAGPATVIARDGGVASAMAFAVRYPGLLARGVMLNPRRPRAASRTVTSPMDAVTAMLLRHPRLADPFARMITRQTREDVLTRLLTGVYAAVEADRLCAQDPAVMQLLIADLRGLVGRSAEGFAAEHQLFAEGWTPPPNFEPAPWTFAFSGGLWPDRDLAVWRGLAAGPLTIVPQAGQLIQFTHADALVGVIAS